MYSDSYFIGKAFLPHPSSLLKMLTKSWKITDLFLALFVHLYITSSAIAGQTSPATTVPAKKSAHAIPSSVFHKAAPAKFVDTCGPHEACVFSWACDRITKPVRPCSGPFYFFTVCCKTGSGGNLVESPQDIRTSMGTTLAVTRPMTTTTAASGTMPTSVMPTTGPIRPVTLKMVPSTTAVMPSVKRVCGQAPLLSRVGRIVGGSAVQYGEFPFQAMVVIKGAEKCGGALLDHQWVVTAGHCVASSSVSASDFVVKLGVWDRTRTGGGLLPVEERLVSRVILHPTYGKFRSFSQDLALLKLNAPVVYGPHIQPICLPSPNDDFTYLLATITGWGRLQFREDRPTVLQKVDVPIIPNYQCEELFNAQHTPEKVLPDMMCATTDNGTKDACQGDSGGPLSIIRDGAHILAGLVSWGYGCALPGYPGVYARMSKFTAWLEDTMRKES